MNKQTEREFQIWADGLGSLSRACGAFGYLVLFALGALFIVCLIVGLVSAADNCMSEVNGVWVPCREQPKPPQRLTEPRVSRRNLTAADEPGLILQVDKCAANIKRAAGLTGGAYGRDVHPENLDAWYDERRHVLHYAGDSQMVDAFLGCLYRGGFAAGQRFSTHPNGALQAVTR
jgi:hypothetical protein